MTTLLERAASRRLTTNRDVSSNDQGHHPRPASPTIQVNDSSDDRRDQRALKRLSTSSMTKTGSGDSFAQAKAEVFFIVRPPPSHMSHRSNLQVQLINTSGTGVVGTAVSGRTRYTNGLPGGHSSGDVSRNTAGTGNSMFAVANAGVNQHQGTSANTTPLPTPLERPMTPGSTAGTPTDEDAPLYNQSELSRTLSSRSNRSQTSLASSSASGTRRMLPCYNLEFHALQPSVVTDACTDAKICKIHKRGVEMLDLAMLDPVVYGQHTAIPTLAERETTRKQAEAAQKASQSNGLVEMKDFKPGNILNKLKRMSFRSGSSNTPPAASTSTSEKLSKSTSGPSSDTRRFSSFLGSSTSSSAPSVATSIPAVPLFREGEGQSASGALKDLVTPAAGSSVDGTVFSRHAPGYVWIVRNLLRKDLVTQANNVADFRLEWRKRRRRTAGQSAGPLTSARSRNSVIIDQPASRRQSRDETENLRGSTSTRNSRSFDAARPTGAELGRSESRRSRVSSSPTRSSALDFLSPNRLGKARSGGSSRSANVPSPSDMLSPNRNSLISPGGASIMEEEDSGDESDPEDSETPWSCDLVVTRRASAPNDRQRYFLGSLTPAPHHPKLIAHLAVPVSLVPISIANSLSTNSRQMHSNDLTLSIEELKDLMAVTGLWLVVRENLGLSGTSKARKNDGSWRMTALATPSALKQ